MQYFGSPYVVSMMSVSAWRHSAGSAEWLGRSLKSPVYNSDPASDSRKSCADPKMCPAGSSVAANPSNSRRSPNGSRCCFRTPGIRASISRAVPGVAMISR